MERRGLSVEGAVTSVPKKAKKISLDVRLPAADTWVGDERWLPRTSLTVVCDRCTAPALRL